SQRAWLGSTVRTRSRSRLPTLRQNILLWRRSSRCASRPATGHIRAIITPVQIWIGRRSGREGLLLGLGLWRRIGFRRQVAAALHTFANELVTLLIDFVALAALIHLLHQVLIADRTSLDRIEGRQRIVGVQLHANRLSAAIQAQQVPAICLEIHALG